MEIKLIWKKSKKKLLIYFSRQVKYQEGKDLQENYQLHFFMETSAKTGVNAQEMFVKCAEVLYKDYLQYNKNNPTPKKDDNNNQK